VKDTNTIIEKIKAKIVALAILLSPNAKTIPTKETVVAIMNPP
jgi:hypothetical protein